MLTGPYPESVKAKLRNLGGPLTEDNYVQRLLDPHWSRAYTAAWVYLWEHQNPGKDPLKFMQEKWNGNPGGKGRLKAILNWNVKKNYSRLWNAYGHKLLDYYNKGGAPR